MNNSADLAQDNLNDIINRMFNNLAKITSDEITEENITTISNRKKVFYIHLIILCFKYYFAQNLQAKMIFKHINMIIKPKWKILWTSV